MKCDENIQKHLLKNILLFVAVRLSSRFVFTIFIVPFRNNELQRLQPTSTRRISNIDNKFNPCT